MSEHYRLNDEDLDILEAVGLLLRTIVSLGLVSPAELVTVAKLLHCLAMAPQVTHRVSGLVSIETQSQYDGSISYHWKFELYEGCLSVTTGGSSFHPDAGYECFSTMEWFINPPNTSVYNGIWDEHWMVPEFRYNADRKLSMDLNSGEYTFKISDDDNPLLNDYRSEEEH